MTFDSQAHPLVGRHLVRVAYPEIYTVGDSVDLSVSSGQHDFIWIGIYGNNYREKHERVKWKYNTIEILSFIHGV